MTRFGELSKILGSQKNWDMNPKNTNQVPSDDSWILAHVLVSESIDLFFRLDPWGVLT